MSAHLRDESAIRELLRQRTTFVLTTHVNPDGDAMGSEAALAGFLRDAGKTATIINHSPTPAVYDFLDPENTIRTYDPARDDSLLASADVIVILDANQPDRVASMERAVLASPAVKICIDHHLDPHPFANYTLVDDDATSTGEIIYRLLTSIPDVSFSRGVASALYTAIMTDTGSFRYPRVDAAIHRAVAHLLECGADPVALYTNVYERWSPGRIHLLGETLAELKTAAGGRIASVSITRAMLLKTGTAEEDTDNFTTYPMSLQGVSVGILFLEVPDGVKISFRSRGDIPVNELAREFGGNGHKNAAGARIQGVTLADIEQRVLNAARNYV
jgi:phosphoesterase RecJ-like protein